MEAKQLRHAQHGLADCRPSTDDLAGILQCFSNDDRLTAKIASPLVVGIREKIHLAHSHRLLILYTVCPATSQPLVKLSKSSSNSSSSSFLE